MSIASRLTLRVLPALLAGAAVSGVQAPPAAEMRTLTYASRDGADLRLDLYLPAQPIRRPTPVIVFLHGGGWSGGTRTTGPDFSRYFARDGFAMASIEYRLTPSITFPANVEDVRTAVRWLKANAAAHALDPDRICLWGTSAGGHLAAVAGVGAARHVRGHRQSELHERRPLRAGRLWSDALRRDGRPDRGGTGERCSLPWSPSTSAGADAAPPRPRCAAGAERLAAGAGGRDRYRMTTPPHPSRGCWARPFSPFRTGCAPPAR